MIIAICPGSFDPIQIGHLDIIKRASMLTDKVYVVIGVNPDKKALFTIKQRMDFIKKVTKGIDNIEIAYNEGLTVDYAKKVGAKLIIKGYRNDDDLKYEQDMAIINKRLAPGIDTLILKASLEYVNISSSLIKDTASLDELSKYLPKEIQKSVFKVLRHK